MLAYEHVVKLQRQKMPYAVTNDAQNMMEAASLHLLLVDVSSVLSAVMIDVVERGTSTVSCVVGVRRRKSQLEHTAARRWTEYKYIPIYCLVVWHNLLKRKQSYIFVGVRYQDGSVNIHIYIYISIIKG